MKIIKNKFKNLLIIEGQLHEDKRGYLREVYLKKLNPLSYKNFSLRRSSIFIKFYFSQIKLFLLLKPNNLDKI